MVLKTFNVSEDIYARFSGFCKSSGISMSKQIDLFMQSFLEDNPQAKREYLEKIERIRKGKFVQVKNFADRYGL